MQMLGTWTGFGRLVEFSAGVIFECADKPESFQTAFVSVRKGGPASLTGRLGGLINESTG